MVWLLALGVILGLVALRRRRKVKLAGLTSTAPVYTLAPPRGRVERQRWSL
jgi:hypothetical protein